MNHIYLVLRHYSERNLKKQSPMHKKHAWENTSIDTTIKIL